MIQQVKNITLEWLNREATEKQLNYLNELIDIYNEQNKIEEKNNKEEEKNNKEEKKTKYDVIFLIDSYKKKIKIYPSIITFLESRITLDVCKNILKRDIQNYGDITLYEFKKIIESNDDFNFYKTIVSYVPERLQFIFEFSDIHEYGISRERYNINNFIYYIKFYDLLLLDYDDIDIETVKKNLNLIKQLTNKKILFRIYKTYKGYHVFIISHLISYNSPEAITIAKYLNCDPWYIIYFKYYGYSIRISNKLGREEEYNHIFISEYGDGKPNKKCMKMIKIFEYYENKIKKNNENKNISFDNLNNMVIKPKKNLFPAFS